MRIASAPPANPAPIPGPQAPQPPLIVVVDRTPANLGTPPFVPAPTFQASGDNTCNLQGNGRTWFNSPDGKTVRVYAVGETIDMIQKPQADCGAWYQARGRELAARMCGINLPGGKVAEIPVSLLPQGMTCAAWIDAKGKEATASR